MDPLGLIWPSNKACWTGLALGNDENHNISRGRASSCLKAGTDGDRRSVQESNLYRLVTTYL